MYARMNRILIAALATLAVVTMAGISAAQQISGVNGQVCNGSTITITGSSFGPRASSDNTIFDDLESGSLSPRWGATGELSVSTSPGHGDSQIAATVNFNGSTRSGYVSSAANDAGPWFCQYWFRLGDDWDWGDATDGSPGANLSRVTLFRMGAEPGAEEDFRVRTRGWDGRVEIGIGGPGGQVPEYAVNDYKMDWAKNQWHLFQFEFRDSSPGSSDGAFRWWVDGELAYENAQLMTRRDETGDRRPLVVGFGNSWGETGGDDNHFWIDDLYVDNSWARVELGNSSSYEACTHREIQAVESWSDSQIGIRVNQGSFAVGGNAYLFVVGPGGERSAGYAVTVCGAVEGPGQPGKPEF